MHAASVGSLPGDDFLGAARWIVDALAPHATMPQLPARGVTATMVGQAIALLDGLGADLQPSGWRLTPGSGADQRRARALWRRDLDELEEVAHDYDGELTVPVCGPWTLAASVSRPLGDLVLGDHGARRELSESLASGYADALAEIGRRLPRATVRAQLDEPMLPMVLAARVPTASGFSKHRRVDVADASAGLRRVVDAVRPMSTGVGLHCCAPGLDLDLVQRSGFTGVAVDARTLDHRQRDQVAAWIEDGRQLWLGCVPTHVPDAAASTDDVVRSALESLRPLELDPSTVRERVALIPACGLATWTPSPARRVLEALHHAVPLVEEQLDR